MKQFKYYILSAGLVALIACGSSTSTTTSSGGATANAAAAVGSAFSGGGSSSISNPESALLQEIVSAFAQRAIAQESNDTCDTLDENPGNVTSSAQGTSGTYGSATDSVTVDADTDFCQDSSGSDNTDTGPGESGLFASFTLSSADISCDDGETLTMSGTGIWRNRSDIDIYPEIFGQFEVTDSEGTAETVNCTLALDEDGDVDASLSSCTAEDDDSEIEIDSSVTCNITAD